MEIEFKPEPYLYVNADSPEKAREFFGAPKDWPCRCEGLDNRNGRKIFVIPTERWVSVSPGTRYKEKLVL